jgi:hypothetical protein
MRRLVPLLTFLAIALPAHAAQRVTVEELQRILTAESEAHEKDAAIAHRIGLVELTERLTDPTLEKIVASFKPGPKTALALEMLADVSSFLEPPISELPDKDPPDKATQQSMIDGAANFAANTLHRLPDFLATRETRSFDDGAPTMPSSATLNLVAPTDLHLTNSLSERITYRNGEELSITPNGKTKPEATPPGLSSSGEFGPTLITLLADSAKGRIVWSHWEQMPSGLAAVFSYEVPAAVSRYRVDYCCTRGGTDNNDGSNSYHGTPGYHGFIYIDPATGAVLRYTLNSELRDSDAITRSAVLVQYGEVGIGGNNYLCPVRGQVVMEGWHAVGSPPRLTTVLSINEVSFTDYRHFGSTARVLPATP